NVANALMCPLDVLNSPKPYCHGEGSVAAGFSLDDAAKNLSPNPTSARVALRPKTNLYNAWIRFAGFPPSASTRPERCLACSATNVLFKRKRACCGTVVL